MHITLFYSEIFGSYILFCRVNKCTWLPAMVSTQICNIYAYVQAVCNVPSVHHCIWQCAQATLRPRITHKIRVCRMQYVITIHFQSISLNTRTDKKKTKQQKKKQGSVVDAVTANVCVHVAPVRSPMTASANKSYNNNSLRPANAKGKLPNEASQEGNNIVCLECALCMYTNPILLCRL